MLQKFNLMHSSDSRDCLQENVTAWNGLEWNIREREKKKLQSNWKKIYILTLDLMLECIGILLCSLWGCFVWGHRTRLKITTGRRLARMEKD